jgi:hypothetical protein
MAAKLDHRGWTAAEYLAPCVICGRPAILRSPRGKPCHWSCALAWTKGEVREVRPADKDAAGRANAAIDRARAEAMGTRTKGSSS